MPGMKDTAASPVRRHSLVVLADTVNATQWISFAEPTHSDAANFERVDLVADSRSYLAYMGQEAFWRSYKPSILVLSRFVHEGVFPVLKLARRHGVPTIFHLDDDLLDVPLSLGRKRYEFYRHPDRLRNLRETMNSVDLVYASTQPLARRLAEHGISTPIFAGTIYCSVDPRAFREPLPATGPVIGYMGTGGHSMDLGMVMPTIVRLMREVPSLRFETFGTITPPPEIATFEGRHAHHDGVADYSGFVARLNEMGWWIGIAPLEDTSFNRCKADTKWVEYSMAGMAVVASDLPVYHRACADGSGATADTEADWYSQLSGLLRDGECRRRMISTAREKLARHYTHDQLRRQLLTVIERAAYEHGKRAA